MQSKEVGKRVKAYFLIVNLVFAIVAFNYLISATIPSAIIPTESGLEKGIYMKVEDRGVEHVAKWTGNKMVDDVEMSNGIFENGQEGSWETIPNAEVEIVNLNAFQKEYFKKLTPGTLEIDPAKFKELGISDVQYADNKITVIGDSGREVWTKTAEGWTSKDAGLGFTKGIKAYFKNNLLDNLFSAAGMGLVTGGIGTMLGGEDGFKWGFVSGFTGTVAKQIAENIVAKGNAVFNLGKFKVTPGWFGIGVGVAIFVLTYKKESKKIVEFNCEPWQPPIGGADCEDCNKYGDCSEYRCKSLGQACELLNEGTEDEKCTWVNPRDVTSPTIKVGELLEDYKWVPDTVVRPPATGVVISQIDRTCVEAFTPLEFMLVTNEPAQCKIDYNITNGFEEMSYYIGGSNLFDYNHTEIMSLPGPDAINAVAPELQNDGTYTLYARCQDANGNFNQDAFSVRFCVNPGPDTTAPRIEDVSVLSNSPVNYDQTTLDLKVYINEPANCKWSRSDTTYENMETPMSCSTSLFEINNQNVYTCETTLTGLVNRETNSYYFRCKDVSDNQNENTQSYLYNVIGTQPLNILEVGPANETIRGPTDTIPVFLTVKTDSGYDNGEAICYYSTTDDEDDYVEFLETGGNEHEQRQDLASGAYTYYYKCVDLGGNADYDSTQFDVESDKQGPIIVRVYKEGGELKIITHEKAECSYSNLDCNFEIDEGIEVSTYDNEAHTAEWKTTQNYYIRCKDEYENQPGPNTCSAIVRPYEVLANGGVIEL